MFIKLNRFIERVVALVALVLCTALVTLAGSFVIVVMWIITDLIKKVIESH